MMEFIIYSYLLEVELSRYVTQLKMLFLLVKCVIGV